MTDYQTTGRNGLTRYIDRPIAGNAMADEYTHNRAEPLPGDPTQRALDTVATGTMALPIAGDIAGAAADANMYWNEPESRNWKNYGLSALGLLPFVPAASIARQAGKAVKKAGKTTANLPIKNATESLSDVTKANFTHGRVVGERTVPLDSLQGAKGLVSVSDASRVDELAKAMGGKKGFIRRLIVDTNGIVIEGQHRLAALQRLGIDDVPVHVIEDLTSGVDMRKLDEVVSGLENVRGDNRYYLKQNALEMAKESGSGAAALKEFDLPAGWEDEYKSVLNAIDDTLPLDEASRMGRTNGMAEF